jgi:hypothetical protein
VAQAQGAEARDGAFRQWVVIAGRGVAERDEAQTEK